MYIFRYLQILPMTYRMLRTTQNIRGIAISEHKRTAQQSRRPLKTITYHICILTSKHTSLFSYISFVINQWSHLKHAFAKGCTGGGVIPKHIFY